MKTALNSLERKRVKRCVEMISEKGIEYFLNDIETWDIVERIESRKALKKYNKLNVVSIYAEMYLMGFISDKELDVDIGDLL